MAVYSGLAGGFGVRGFNDDAGEQPIRSFPNLISHLATLSRNDLGGLTIAVRLYGALAAASGPSVHDELTAELVRFRV